MQAKNITYSHQGGSPLFNALNVTIKKGQITTIIGPNGCGKSTLLGLLTKAYQPESGEILLDGVPVKIIKGKQFSRKVAVVHQQNTSELEMTVEELVVYGRSPYQGFCQKDPEQDALVTWALECMKLTDIREKPLHQLSGGQRQRAWIAMSICQQSELLFLDEPTTYLDIHYQLDLLEQIQMLNRRFKLTIVMVLHDMNQALQYSDHVIVMKEGKIVTEGHPDSVIDEELLEEVYGIKGKIYKEETGRFVVPYGIVRA